MANGGLFKDASGMFHTPEAAEAYAQMNGLTYRSSYTTPYTQHAGREGENFTVVGVITDADDTHDREVLPMYLIRFDDGEVIEAWPEEVLPLAAR